MTVIKVIAIILIGLILLFLVKNNRVPKELGVVDGQLAPLPGTPNGVSSQTDHKDLQVEPLPFRGSLEDSHERMLRVLTQYGRMEIIRVSPTYIHAVHTSKWVGFKDDIEVFFDVEEEMIHYRSASRIGYGDMGVNRERYQALKALYLEE